MSLIKKAPRLKTLAESLSRSQIPRELIFLVRAQRMLQVENQILGSPSNRVNITAKARLPLLVCPGPHSQETDPRPISCAHSGLLEDTLSPNHRPVTQFSRSAFDPGSRSSARFLPSASPSSPSTPASRLSVSALGSSRFSASRTLGSRRSCSASSTSLRELSWASIFRRRRRLRGRGHHLIETRDTQLLSSILTVELALCCPVGQSAARRASKRAMSGRVWGSEEGDEGIARPWDAMEDERQLTSSNSCSRDSMAADMLSSIEREREREEVAGRRQGPAGACALAVDPRAPQRRVRTGNSQISVLVNASGRAVSSHQPPHIGPEAEAN